MELQQTFRVVHLCVDDRIDRRILDGARLLAEAGWPTLVIAGPAPGDLKDEESYPDVPVFRLRTPQVVPAPRTTDWSGAHEDVMRRGLRFPWHRRLLSAALAFPAEVYIANDLPQLAAGILAAHHHGATLVYDAHEFYPSQPFTRNASAELEETERALITAADLVVTVNDSIADIMAMKYGCQRPEVVLNCPSRRHQVPAVTQDNLLRAFTGVSPAQRVLLYQGNLAASRNLEPLIDAMALMPDDRIVLALMGKASAVGDALRQRAADRHVLGTRVHFIPEQSAATLLSWTAGADAGIIPYPHSDLNTWLVSPNKLFEFLAAGVPILASHGPELRRFVGDREVGMNAHLATPDDFARAISTFFAGPVNHWRARTQAVAERFTWEVEGRQWLSLLASAQATHDSRMGSRL
jgi:glycosyltransferase involved in cell wall biosynthesis